MKERKAKMDEGKGIDDRREESTKGEGRKVCVFGSYNLCVRRRGLAKEI